MAQRKSPTKQTKYEMAPFVRHNFLKAIRELQRRTGKKPYQIMADWLEEDPLNTLRAVGQFKEQTRVDVTGSISHQHDHKHTVTVEQREAAVSQARARLVELGFDGAGGRPAPDGEDGLVFPPPLHARPD